MKVIVLPDAEERLKRTLRYYDLHASKRVSAKLRTRIRAAILDLKLHHQGPLEPLLDHLHLGHRRTVVGPFKIIYRVLPERSLSPISSMAGEIQIP